MTDMSQIRATKFVGYTKEFMTAMGQTITPSQQIKLVAEESKELIDAYNASVRDLNPKTVENVLKELADFIYVLAGLAAVLEEASKDPSYRIPDEDMITLLGALQAEQVILAVNDFIPGEVFQETIKRVHESNMSKLGEDGKPVFDEHGKVLKGPNYQPPYLEDLAAVVFSNVLVAVLVMESIEGSKAA